MTYRRFTQRDLDRMFHRRDIEGWKWRVIGEDLGRDAATCCWAYHYYHAKLKTSLAREECAAPVTIPQASAPCARPFKVRAASAKAPVNRPRYFHEADADLRARIDRQGITAGFFGDPPHGRSALDRRQP